MLYTIAVILFILWLLGFLVFPVAGGLIHILLVLAIIAILLRVIQGAPPALSKARSIHPFRLGLAVVLCASGSCFAHHHLGLEEESGDWGAGTAQHQVGTGPAGRTFLLHVPAELRAPPLLIVLHGSSGTSEAVRHASQLDAVADREHFLVAYPQASKGKLGLSSADWNAGTCCGDASRDNVDDVAFLDGVIDRVAKHYPIDRRRIYVAGFSDGGRMAYRFACARAAVVGGIAVVAGSLTEARCAPAAPVSIVAFHATADDEVPYADRARTRAVGPTMIDTTMLPPALRFWSAVDACRARSTQRVSPNVLRISMTQCDARTEIALYSIEGGAHGWPGEPAPGAGSVAPMNEIGASDIAVRFLLAHRR